ncbi:hypothetical protein HMPREF0496_0873 [Lentilactobacillus hilgardii ATCC 27305]|nr:hypothetical protein HMPREF0496_0873 [Lentilactobacillus hilgardii ATCC 27305]
MKAKELEIMDDKKTISEKQSNQQHPKKSKESKEQVRRVIGGLHIRLEEDGKRTLATDHEFFWKIGKKTGNEGSELVDGFPELGRVAVVETKFGWRPVLVVREQTVTGEAAVKAADDLRHVSRFTANDVHTYHLVRPFKKYLKDNHIQDPRDEKNEKADK